MHSIVVEPTSHGLWAVGTGCEVKGGGEAHRYNIVVQDPVLCRNEAEVHKVGYRPEQVVGSDSWQQLCLHGSVYKSVSKCVIMLNISRCLVCGDI